MIHNDRENLYSLKDQFISLSKDKSKEKNCDCEYFIEFQKAVDVISFLDDSLNVSTYQNDLRHKCNFEKVEENLLLKYENQHLRNKLSLSNNEIIQLKQQIGILNDQIVYLVENTKKTEELNNQLIETNLGLQQSNSQFFINQMSEKSDKTNIQIETIENSQDIKEKLDIVKSNNLSDDIIPSKTITEINNGESYSLENIINNSDVLEQDCNDLQIKYTKTIEELLKNMQNIPKFKPNSVDRNIANKIDPILYSIIEQINSATNNFKNSLIDSEKAHKNNDSSTDENIIINTTLCQNDCHIQSIPSTDSFIESQSTDKTNDVQTLILEPNEAEASKCSNDTTNSSIDHSNTDQTNSLMSTFDDTEFSNPSTNSLINLDESLSKKEITNDSVENTAQIHTASSQDHSVELSSSIANSLNKIEESKSGKTISNDSVELTSTLTESHYHDTTSICDETSSNKIDETMLEKTISYDNVESTITAASPNIESQSNDLKKMLAKVANLNDSVSGKDVSNESFDNRELISGLVDRNEIEEQNLHTNYSNKILPDGSIMKSTDNLLIESDKSDIMINEKQSIVEDSCLTDPQDSITHQNKTNIDDKQRPKSLYLDYTSDNLKLIEQNCLNENVENEIHANSQINNKILSTTQSDDNSTSEATIDAELVTTGPKINRKKAFKKATTSLKSDTDTSQASQSEQSVHSISIDSESSKTLERQKNKKRFINSSSTVSIDEKNSTKNKSCVPQ